MSERLGIDLGGDPDVLVRAFENWPAFEDTVESLKFLSERYQLGILSNVEDRMFDVTRQRLEHGFKFAFVVTAGSLGGIYKPDVRVFEAAESQHGLDRNTWLHVAQSQYHDIAPARELAITSVHVDRRPTGDNASATPASDAAADVTVKDLAELVALMGG